MSQKICVFCSSSNAVDQSYLNATSELGSLLAQQKSPLIYGAGNLGLMGVLAEAVHAGGGQVIGVIPRALREYAVCYEECDELIVTEDMRQRKAKMDSLAEAFVVLPGGFGTLEEALEIITLKQLKYHNRPIVFVNTNQFFDPLLAMFEHCFDERFAKANNRQLYAVVATPADALAYIAGYKPTHSEAKWF